MAFVVISFLIYIFMPFFFPRRESATFFVRHNGANSPPPDWVEYRLASSIIKTAPPKKSIFIDGQ
jgi:hypothetical protein